MNPKEIRQRRLREIGLELLQAQHAVLDGLSPDPSRSSRAIIAAIRERLDAMERSLKELET